MAQHRYKRKVTVHVISIPFAKDICFLSRFHLWNHRLLHITSDMKKYPVNVSVDETRDTSVNGSACRHFSCRYSSAACWQHYVSWMTNLIDWHILEFLNILLRQVQIPLETDSSSFWVIPFLLSTFVPFHIGKSIRTTQWFHVSQLLHAKIMSQTNPLLV